MTKKRGSETTRSVVWTINYTDYKDNWEDIPALTCGCPNAHTSECAWKDKDIAYMVWSLEKGESGTPHYQGYTKFNKPRRYNTVKQHMGQQWARAHFEKAKGNAKQNKDYIAHEDKHNNKQGLLNGPWEYPSPLEKSKQGKRTDIESAVRTAISGGMLEVIEKHPGAAVRYYGNLEKIANAWNYAQIANNMTRQIPKVIVLYGPSGRGKSETAMALSRALTQQDNEVYYVSEPKGSGLYWDFYDPTRHKVVVFEEFRGQYFQPQTWNRLIDKYPVSVPTHGNRGPQFRSEYIIVTTNIKPTEWWKNTTTLQETWLRRITLYFDYSKTIKRPTTRRQAYEQAASEGMMFCSLDGVWSIFNKSNQRVAKKVHNEWKFLVKKHNTNYL